MAYKQAASPSLGHGLTIKAQMAYRVCANIKGNMMKIKRYSGISLAMIGLLMVLMLFVI